MRYNKCNSFEGFHKRGCKCFPVKQLTDTQIKALVAHLRDYISLMDTIWPNEDDVIKSKAKALFKEITHV